LVLRQHFFDLNLLLIGDSQEFFEYFGVLALEVGDAPLSGLVALPLIHELLCVLFVLKGFVDLVPYLGLAAGLEALISFFVECLIQEQKLAGEFSILM
jgi:hypothetical protein